MKSKKIVTIILGLLLVLSLIGCSNNSSKSSSSDNNKSGGSDGAGSATGGTITVAYNAQPETLDPTVTTAEATRDPAKLIYESLVTLDENYQATPLLAESYKISDDGKTIVFNLRKGIKFHNGQEMKADDVVASMERWDKSSSLAKSTLSNPKWVKKDDYTVELQLDQPSSIVMSVLSDTGQLAAIMPKDIVESAGDTGATKYVGTGPFQLVDWKKDQYMEFKKFKDYQPLSTPASGLGGKKEALVDTIKWNFVKDESTRINGLISSQYDFAHMLSYDAVDQIKATPGKKVDVWPYGMEVLVFNKAHGVFKDEKVRQAVNYGLDNEAIMQAAFTDPKYYTLDPSLFLPNQKDWYNEAGKDLYNTHNLDKAKELLKESGYNGEQVTILTSRDYSYHYNAAVATQQQLQAIGINAKLDVYDWATLLQRRSDPKKWDIFFTGWPTQSIPQQYIFFSSKAKWAGWTNNPEFDSLLSKISASKDNQTAKDLYKQLQQKMWEYLPIINVGKDSRVSAYSEKLKGYKNFLGPVFWNVSKSN